MDVPFLYIFFWSKPTFLLTFFFFNCSATCVRNICKNYKARFGPIRCEQWGERYIGRMPPLSDDSWHKRRRIWWLWNSWERYTSCVNNLRLKNYIWWLIEWQRKSKSKGSNCKDGRIMGDDRWGLARWMERFRELLNEGVNEDKTEEKAGPKQ